MTTNLYAKVDDRHRQTQIKVLLVDDVRVVREKIKSLLKSARDIRIVGIAADGDSALEQIEDLQPDLILLDLDMPGLDGMQTAQIIGQQYPDLKVIIISSLECNAEVRNTLSVCVQDYILKAEIDLEIADKIRAVYHNCSPEYQAARGNVVNFNRFEQTAAATSQFTDGTVTSSGGRLSRFTSLTHTSVSKLQDWSHSAKELIDTMPLPWTRGLLYALLLFVGVTLPWAFLYRIDEIATARGRLETQGNTIKREADIEGSVAVIKVAVKKGDRVKAGQTIMELDSKNIREQIYQNQLVIDGKRQSLDRLLLMKQQLSFGTNVQQQQNQAQQLEKQSQIAQAQQNLQALAANARNQTAEKLAQLDRAKQTLTDRQASYNLQKAEKLTQVRQAEQGVVDASTSQLIAQNRLRDALTEVSRYRQLFQSGAVAEVKVKEVEGIAQEKNQLASQAAASLQQAKLRVAEQHENYRKLLQQARADIVQAKLRLREQQQTYQRDVNQTQAEIAQAQLRLTEQQRGARRVATGGKMAVLQTDRQSKEIESQIVALRSEIDRNRAQGNFLAKQLAKYLIKADTNGTIFQLPIERAGAVVQPKQLLAEIAPDARKLVFKGEISADRSESLRTTATQKDVKLKFDEFPFESYDVVKGKLTWIAPNSKLTQTPERGLAASYEIEVQLAQACVKHEGGCIPFMPGQPATAEIAIRERRIIDFVLDPFKKLGDNNR